jgi:hypothetical protein
MAKIPVGKTIADAYGFAFGKFLTNVGIVWLPLALLLAAGWYFLPPYFAALTDVMSHLKPVVLPNGATFVALNGMMGAYRLAIIFYIAQVALAAQMMLGLTREAFGQRQGPAFAYLSVGPAFWRLFGAYLAVVVILLAVDYALVIAAVLVAAVAGIAGAAVVAIVNVADKTALAIVAGASIVALILAVAAAVLYIRVRLTFLLTPAIVAEGKLTLARPWQLARGNFWRIVVIGIAIFVPLGIAFNIVCFLAVTGVFLPFPHFAFHPHDPAAAAEFLRAFGAHVAESLRARWFILVPVVLAWAAMFFGIAAGASASAYRSLVAGEKAN